MVEYVRGSQDSVHPDLAGKRISNANVYGSDGNQFIAIPTSRREDVASIFEGIVGYVTTPILDKNGDPVTIDNPPVAVVLDTPDILGHLVKDWELTPIDAAQADTDAINAPIQALEKAIRKKKWRFTLEAARRASLVDPTLDTVEELKAFKRMWQLNPPTNPTADQVKIKDIGVYATITVVSKIDGMADWVAVNAIDQTSDDPFGDGSVWP